MKNLFKVALLATGLFTFSQAHAQSKVDRDAKAVGHKTSEIAANGASTVVDKRYRDKRGPHGEAVYIDKHSRYYYISKKGHKVYTTKSALKNETED
ncbi:MAG: hypothetical protein ACHQF4_04865 [Sphingobacteriales bacterium]